MTRELQKYPEGSSSASAIYTLVGVALSLWEDTDDQTTRLYEAIIGTNRVHSREVQNFVLLRRLDRSKIIRQAVNEDTLYIDSDMKKSIEYSLKTIDKLGEIRNQLAHGRVINYQATHNGEEIANGIYLLPSEVKGSRIERMHKYSHTERTINKFIVSLRALRSEIIDYSTKIFLARQKEYSSTKQSSKMLIDCAERILLNEQSPRSMDATRDLLANQLSRIDETEPPEAES